MWSDSSETAGAAGSAALDSSQELQTLIDEMRVQDFDSIRFATYRTACKLRFIQKKTNVHLVDIWNMIESFRENGLNALPTHAQVKTSRLELLLTTIFHNLNKRLPTAQHIDTDRSIALLLSFLLGAYDRQRAGRLTVFSIKIALATICAGKLVDKLRYVFSLISDTAGIMEQDKFTDYLQQVLALATAVFEAPTFGFSETAVGQCFKKEEVISLNHFLDVLMNDPCPPCLMWLPLLHRMSSVEHVYHPVVCDACQVRSFTGFRYKCQRCSNYQLCQQCFWRGRTSQSHSNEHEMKEYSSYKSPTKQLAHSIHKSLQCIPTPQSKSHKAFPPKPQRPLDLANIVPMTPSTFRHQTGSGEAVAVGGGPDWALGGVGGTLLLPSNNGGVMDDEHKLIARYSAKLAGRTVYPSTASIAGMKPVRSTMMDSLDERAMIAQLEEENGEMLREMASLDQQAMMNDSSDQLMALREKKSELELKMRTMQQTRRQLMQQLETVMSQLNTTSMSGGGTMGRAMSSLGNLPDSLSGIGNRVSSAFREPNVPRAGSLPASQLQGDLLSAADDITENITLLMEHARHEVEDAPLPGDGLYSRSVGQF
ncbi:hypothetical protein QR680_009559 [Steinernema hermaphroditum]|uniref:Dystrobrevin n=1 Tax=Steinernema hermaphroditum TaxID=289476 RepID=A0AA39MA64_9BILA|nr:hypothetical protein QR680_009559 [Steinernema hermaphroditum]